MSNVNDTKILVISVPKSGTYLFSEILKLSGFSQTMIHITRHGYDDYKNLSFEDGRSQPELGRHYCSASEALRLIPAGSFAVSHLRHEASLVQDLMGFRLVFLKRDPREALVSMMRFVLESGRAEKRQVQWRQETGETMFHRFLEADGPSHLEHFRALLPWLSHPDILVLDHKELTDRSHVSQALTATLRSLGRDDLDLPRILDTALQTQTLTKSSSPSSLAIWDDWCEAWWREQDGPTIMQGLGYRA